MTAKEPVVIVGTSHAGVAVAADLRTAGLDVPIVLVGEEKGLPYHRPHLSKDALADGATPGLLRPARFYEEKAIEIRCARVHAIDREAQALQLEDGGTLSYGRLILATGATARALPPHFPGVERVHVLRDQADWCRLTTGWSGAQRIAVIGGGLIGLEVAAAARARGLDVAVLEGSDRLMARSLYPELGAVILERHRAAGIDVHLSVRVEAVTEAGVTLSDGSMVPADLVLAAVGSHARDDLARAAGLPCDDGVIVNHRGETADPAIFALGDCARWPDEPVHVRHESVAATQWQAKCIAAAIAGTPAPTPSALRLWSTQGEMRLQMSGPVRADARTSVERFEGGGLLLRAFAGGRLVAVQALDAARPFNSEVARLGAAEGEFVQDQPAAVAG